MRTKSGGLDTGYNHYDQFKSEKLTDNKTIPDGRVHEATIWNVTNMGPVKPGNGMNYYLYTKIYLNLHEIT